MSSFSAIIPVADMAAANALLEEQGYGPNNFSVPAFEGANPNFGLFHAWADQAFEDAVAAIPNVIIQRDEGSPAATVIAACDAVGAVWGASAPLLEGFVVPGLHRDEEGTLWNVIQAYDTEQWPDPLAVPALVRRVRQPGVAEIWVKPIDAFDSYQLVVEFTGLPEQCVHKGITYVTLVNNNVWEPGAAGSQSLWKKVV